MHTHLKGRVFNSEGICYLVLSEPGESPARLRVKALTAERTVYDMPTEEVEQHLARRRPAVRRSGA